MIEKQITFFKNKGCCTVHPNKALNETKSLPYQLSFFSDFTSHSSFSLKIRKEVLRYSVSYIISLNKCPLIFMEFSIFNFNWRTLTTKSTFRTSGLWSICKCMPMPAVFNFVHKLIISMLVLFFAQHFLPQSFIQPFSPPFPLPLFSLP